MTKLVPWIRSEKRGGKPVDRLSVGRWLPAAATCPAGNIEVHRQASYRRQQLTDSRATGFHQPTPGTNLGPTGNLRLKHGRNEHEAPADYYYC